MSFSFTRRQALALTGSAALASSLPTLSRAGTIPELALYGPPAGPSVSLAHGVATGLFNDLATSTSFTA